jgi:transcription antitermination factor NusB
MKQPGKLNNSNDGKLDRRTLARELAMQALCQLDVQGGDVLPWLGRFFREQTDDPMTISLAEQWARGAWQHQNDCDEKLSGAAAKWKLSRMSQVDRNILRLSVYQLLFCPDIPGKVVVNEAIEMGKKFGAEQSPRFINGVLDSIFKQHRPDPAVPAAASPEDSPAKDNPL